MSFGRYRQRPMIEFMGSTPASVGLLVICTTPPAS